MDGKGHSRMYLTIGRGEIINESKKLGLVTTSTAEIDVVADGESFPKCSWFMYFRLMQGDKVKEDTLMQNNESCALPQKNFTFSTGKGSKHMHVRFFFVVDEIEKKEVRIV